MTITAFDAVSYKTGIGVTSLSWTHVIGLGNNRRVDVTLAWKTAGVVPTDIVITFGGAAMTLLDSNVGADQGVYAWYLFNPPLGPATVSISWSGSVEAVGGAISYFNADQSTPGAAAKANGTSKDPSVVVTSATVDDLVMDVLSIEYVNTDGDYLLVGAGQTERYSDNSSFDLAAIIGAGSTEPGAASVTMSWQDYSTRDWYIMAWPIKGANLGTGLTWLFGVDWNDDGYIDMDEVDHVLGFSSDRGRQLVIHHEQKEVTGLQPIGVGQAFIELKNDDDRYDPFNTSSALYPNVKPGHFIDVKITDNSTAITYPVIAGRIKDITPILSGGADLARIEINDGQDELARDKTTLALLEGYPALDVIGLSGDASYSGILTNVPWPSRWGINTYTDLGVTYDYWWHSGSWLDAIKEICEANFWTFFIARDGKASILSNASLLIVTDTWTEDELYQGIRQSVPWDNTRDRITVKFYKYTKAASATDLWTLGETPWVNPSGTYTVWAEYNGAANVVDPVETTDYKMNSKADGTGTNRTANFTCAATKYSTRSKLVFTNTSADVGAYITLAKIRGKLVTQSSTGSYTDSDSGAYTMTISNPQVNTRSQAIDLTAKLLDMLSAGKMYPVVKVRGHPAIQFARELFDLVTLTVTSKSIDSNFLIGRITHKAIAPGVAETTFYLEAAPTAQTAPVFDAATGNNSGGTTVATISDTHTATGSNLFAKVTLMLGAAVTGLSVTYGGAAMALISSKVSPNSRYLYVYGLVNPPPGEQTVTASWTTNVIARIITESFTGVNQTTPYDAALTASGTGTAQTLAAITSSSVKLVADSLLSNAAGHVLTVGDGQTLRREETSALAMRAAASTEPGAASIIMSWSTDISVDWAQIGFNLNPK